MADRSQSSRSQSRAALSGSSQSKSSRSGSSQSKSSRSGSSRSKIASGSVRSKTAVQAPVSSDLIAVIGRAGLSRDTLPAAPTRKTDAKDRLARAGSIVADSLPLAELKVLTVKAEEAAAAVDEDAAPRTSPVTGEELPSPQEFARIEFENLRRAFTERQEVLRDALTVAQVADLFDKGRQYPHDRQKAGTLLAVKDSGKWLFPRWQFDPDGPDGVVEGLPQVLRAMRGPISALGRIRWFLTEKSLLDGRAPLEALRVGEIDEVVAEAESIGAS